MGMVGSESTARLKAERALKSTRRDMQAERVLEKRTLSQTVQNLGFQWGKKKQFKINLLGNRNSSNALCCSGLL